jgi:SAM-dependent methyltransferase
VQKSVTIQPLRARRPPASHSPFFRAPPIRVDATLPLRLSPELAALFEDRGALDLLEIGCGQAQNREHFLAQGHRYIGLDLESFQADLLADGASLPFREQTFDAVLTIATLQYLLQPEQMLRQVNCVLRLGGTISGTVAFLEPWTWESHVHLTPSGLAKLLQGAGFQIEYLWPGWGAGEAVQGSAFRPFHGMGRALGRVQDLLNLLWFRGCNALSVAFGRSAEDVFLRRLEVAGSLKFHALKTRDLNAPHTGLRWQKQRS